VLHLAEADLGSAFKMSTPKLAIHELHDGGGVPVVLLHPFPFDSRVWAPMALALPWGIRAIAVDLPGFGKSDLGSLAPSVDLAADAVYEALTAYGVGNAIVVGWSMGGYVALALAERHPGFVSGLGLVGSKADADDETTVANRVRIAREVEMGQTVQPVMALLGQILGPTSLARRRALLPTIEAWIRSQHPSGIVWAQRAMARRPDRSHVIAAFPGPVAIIAGAEDLLSPVHFSQEMHQHAQNGHLTVVPGASHLLAIEDPAAVAQAIVDLHAQVVPHGRNAQTSSIPKVRKFSGHPVSRSIPAVTRRSKTR